MRTGYLGFAVALALAFATAAHADDAVLNDMLVKAKSAGVKILVEPFTNDQRSSVMVECSGGYIAEIHAPTRP
jgi:hypothetical protein